MADPIFKQIFVACDHAGLPMKRHLLNRFAHLQWVDLGTDSTESVDYPDCAKSLAEAMVDKPATSCGVLLCGSGQGMAIKANRYAHLRAALCWSSEVAALARQHNDANVLCLGGRTTVFSVAEDILQTFLTTPFEGGRHLQRVKKL